MVNLHQASFNHLNQFKPLLKVKAARMSLKRGNELEAISQVQQDKIRITRYQQFYNGIPIIGAQVTLSKTIGNNLRDNGLVNGHLFEDIQLDTIPVISSKKALSLAKGGDKSSKTHSENSQLQIRVSPDNQLKLVYLVSYKSVSKTNKPIWPHVIIDAQTGTLLKQWNNMQNFSDSGPGGNEKTGEYWYGRDNLSPLEVSQNDETCSLEDEQVKLVNLHFAWDWQGLEKTAFSYPCNNNTEDRVNGAFSVGNDAYYFAHTIVGFYKNWYGVNALQDETGEAQKLIMRVHFGSFYDNAFWDGETMTFGDGALLYPLVSLDIAAHEVSHGFTQQHSNLEYHDESGALNESFSDIAGQAAKAYLLETEPELYNRVYLTPNQITWKIGETVIPSSFSIDAMRFMDLPSLDGRSADCLNKKLARSQKSICAISYPELSAQAQAQFSEEDERQGYIVHTASGVFNRAFYLMAKQLGIKKAFHIMMIANMKYWTPTTGFKEGACGVMDAALDLNTKAEVIESAFKKVGIDLSSCAS